MATTVFSVIGEHRAEPDRLLLLGDDGRYYALTTAMAQPTAVQPTDEWEIDPEVLPPHRAVPTVGGASQKRVPTRDASRFVNRRQSGG